MGDDLPIFEFDPSIPALIEPGRIIKPRAAPPGLVLCFFREVVRQVVRERKPRQVVNSRWEDGPHPIYEIEYAGQRVGFMHCGVGGAVAAGLLEEAIAYGFRNFVVCGGCGVLRRETPVGSLFTVASAVRDEGTSYHYLPPAREVVASQPALERLESVLSRKQAPFRRTKTWTTDAPYRETPLKIAARQSEGCLTVEMEAASLMAVAEFRRLPLAVVLYGGDDLSGSEWDSRGWQSRAEVRRSLFWLAVEAASDLG